MDTAKINLFVYDTPENFNKSKIFLGDEGYAFKRIICIENDKDFFSQLNNLQNDELIFLVVHVFYTEGILGIKKFQSTKISKICNSGYIFISEGDEKEIQHLMVQNNFMTRKIYKYHEIQSNLENDSLTPIEVKDLKGFKKKDSSPAKLNNLTNYPPIDYAVITALHDEFKALEEFFDFPEKEQIACQTKIFRIGYLKSDYSKKIVAAVPNEAGMVDASIIATLLLEYFHPKYLLMSGVCGGAKDFTYGDVIIAKQVFTFQKGKISDLTYKGENGECHKFELFDKEQNKIDYDHLFDDQGNQIIIHIEKFERETEFATSLDSVIEDRLKNKLKSIVHKINDKLETYALNKEIKVELAPIACSTMVINKEGYFENTIKNINRKTAAVEMESYGVVRACQIANNGQTKPIIFKAVMDNTHHKSDTVSAINVKNLAALTSALFLTFLFEEKII